MLTIESTLLANVTGYSDHVSHPGARGRRLDRILMLTILCYFPLVEGTWCKVFLVLTMNDVADRLGPRQAYPDADSSADHLAERGRKRAKPRPRSGRSKQVPNEYTGDQLPPRSEWHSAFRTQEWAGLTTGGLLGFAWEFRP